MTLIPVIIDKETITDSENKKIFNKDDDIVIVDCPGFLDNRCREIDISNSANIRNIITSGKSVRFMVIISYY